MSTEKTVLVRSAVHTQHVLTNTALITEISNYINNYRSSHGVPPLVWEPVIASYSQNWSNYLLSNNIFIHSGTHLYSENLAYFQGYGVDELTLIKLAIDLWYNEIKLYDFNNPGFSPVTGHATALLWKSSTKFAIGFSVNKNNQIVDIVMNMSPPGNILGEFKENVLPAIKSVEMNNQLKSIIIETITIPPFSICNCLKCLKNCEKQYETQNEKQKDNNKNKDVSKSWWYSSDSSDCCSSWSSDSSRHYYRGIDKGKLKNKEIKNKEIKNVNKNNIKTIMSMYQTLQNVVENKNKSSVVKNIQKVILKLHNKAI